jgi:hypothetical protein
MTMGIVNIVAVSQTGDYKLRLQFDDGTIQEVDFSSFLRQSLHPEIRAFLDAKKFADFKLDHGDLMWGDYALCFPIMDLYTNQIDKMHLTAAA